MEFYGYETALEKLTLQMDRDLMKRAVDLVKVSYPEWKQEEQIYVEDLGT